MIRLTIGHIPADLWSANRSGKSYAKEYKNIQSARLRQFQSVALKRERKEESQAIRRIEAMVLSDLQTHSIAGIHVGYLGIAKFGYIVEQIKHSASELTTVKIPDNGVFSPDDLGTLRLILEEMWTEHQTTGDPADCTGHILNTLYSACTARGGIAWSLCAAP